MIKNIVQLIASLLVMLFISGCATTLHEGPVFKTEAAPAADQALVYIYRPDAPPYWRNPTVRIDGMAVFELHNQGYSFIYMKPGTYKLKTDWAWDAGVPDIEGDITVAAGQTYYIRLGGDMQFSGGYQSLNVKTSTSLSEMPHEQALSEIQHCMYVKQDIRQIK